MRAGFGARAGLGVQLSFKSALINTVVDTAGKCCSSKSQDFGNIHRNWVLKPGLVFWGFWILVWGFFLWF